VAAVGRLRKFVVRLRSPYPVSNVEAEVIDLDEPTPTSEITVAEATESPPAEANRRPT